jgi:hypothetical protein
MRLPGRRREDELDEEIEGHLRMAIRERVERGETPEQAEASARKEFGNVVLVKEVTRGMWGWTWLRQFTQDLRYGLRAMRRAPWFTAAAVVTMALGIGANGAIFSVVNAVLLRPLPYPNAGRLVSVKRVDPRGGNVGGTISYPNFTDFRDQTPGLQHAAAYSGSYAWLGGGEEPERIEGVYASAGLFPTLGVGPALGRAYAEEEDRPGAPLVAVISHGLWRRRFGSDPGVIGREILLDGDKTTVIGVMPSDRRRPNSKPSTSGWPASTRRRTPGRGSALTTCRRRSSGTSARRSSCCSARSPSYS